MHSIYAVRNRLSGRVYVGRTTQTVEIRWRQHVHEAEVGKTYLLHAAIRTDGAAAFEQWLLETAFDADAAREAEAWWIARFDSSGLHGYNTYTGVLTDDARRSYGARLREARLAAGLTQRQLARLVARSQPVIASIESASRQCSTRLLLALIRACETQRFVELPSSRQRAHLLTSVSHSQRAERSRKVWAARRLKTRPLVAPENS
jgi:transcriptional regulator with XRE-family HTH domain